MSKNQCKVDSYSHEGKAHKELGIFLKLTTQVCRLCFKKETIKKCAKTSWNCWNPWRMMVLIIIKQTLKVKRLKKQTQVTKAHKISERCGTKSTIDNKGGGWQKSQWKRRWRWDMSKVKCFNYDLYGHLAKECPKPPQVSKVPTQGCKILQGGFKVKVNALHRVNNVLANCFHKVVACASTQANVLVQNCKLVLKTTQSNVLPCFACISYSERKPNIKNPTQHNKESNNR